MKFGKKVIVLFFLVSLTGCASVKSPLSASITGDGKYWILDKPLEFEVDNQTYFVPQGFVTDFASVPRVFWIAFPACSKYTPAAVVHDYLYWVQPENCSKECADKVLLSAMQSSNVKWVTSQAIYRAVDLFGKDAWNDNKKDKANNVIRFVSDDFERKDPNETWEKMELRFKMWKRDKESKSTDR